MAFEDSGWIEFQKINLLYGKNSEGKSVLVRALRLLKQSLTTTEANGPLRFSDENGINLGSFMAVLHRSSLDTAIRFQPGFADASSWTRPIGFAFICEIPSIAIPDLAHSEAREAFKAEDTCCFEFCLSYSYNRSAKQVVCVGLDLWQRATGGWLGERTRLLTLQFDPDLDPKVHAYSSTILSSRSSDAIASCFGIDDSDDSLPLLPAFFPLLTINERYFSEDKEVADVERDQVTDAIKLCSLVREEIVQFLESILYVGPIRPLPERYYLIDQRTTQLLRKQGGEAFVDYLLGKSESELLRGRITKWLSKFGLATSVRRNPENSKDTSDGLVSITELILSEDGDPNDSTPALVEINLTDMGFGASQILPVILACLTALDEAFIIIEQPELHLHPEAQATSADLLIECVEESSLEEKNRASKVRKGLLKEDEKRDRTRVSRRCLIETHSEHILLRLQRRVAESAARAKLADNDWNSQGLRGDLALLFVTRNRASGKSAIEAIQIDPLGRLDDPSPEFRNFFIRAYEDSMERSLAAARAINHQ